MASYRPSAPPYETPNYNNNNYPPPAQSYHVGHESHTSSAAPPPAQVYHVAHESYSPSSPSSVPPYPPPASYGPGPGGYYGGYNNNNPFPPGTDPEIIRSFQMVDRDHSGFVDDSELQRALSSAYHRFSLRTIRLLIFLFKNPSEPSLRLGPTEFAALWRCLGEWRVIFQRFDKDRTGRINEGELRDAFYGLGYAVPPSVLHLLISRYDDGSGRRVALDFDSFVECGMVIKGLTEKFKENDPQYTGSATMSYDSFLSMVLPFLVTYN